MNHARTESRPAVEPEVVAEIASQVFQQLGHLTRELHDSLQEVSVMSRLQSAVSGLPDARSRLDYIARKTGEAADRVLNSVDQAKLENTRAGESTRRIAESIQVDPVRAVASGALLGFVQEIDEAMQRVDRHLTDIMIAQDFHDLTGQVVAKVWRAISRTTSCGCSSRSRPRPFRARPTPRRSPDRSSMSALRTSSPARAR